MNLQETVKSIMSKKLITVSKSAAVLEIEDLFRKNNIHHILVVDGCKLEGIISKSDYLLFKRGFNDYNTDKRIDLFRLKRWTAEKIMTKGIAKLAPTDKIRAAIEIFKENLFHAIPIVEDGTPVGIVTTYDVINHLSRNSKKVVA